MGKTYQSIRNFVGQHPTVAIIVIALGLAVSADRAEAQAPPPATVSIGGFRVQFWQPVNGAYATDGVAIAVGDLRNFSAGERAAVTRSFQYWTNVLGLTSPPPANAPIIRVVIDNGNPNFNAFAVPVTNVDQGAAASEFNVFSRLLRGAAANPARTDGVDGQVVFRPAGLSFDESRIRQLPTDVRNPSFEGIMIHEIGHLLGAANGHTPFLADVNAATGFTTGTETQLISGGTGLPIDITGTDQFSHTMLEFHNLTRGRPFNVDYRNIVAFSPGELAILDDMGYGNGAGLGGPQVIENSFGTAIYDDNTTPAAIAANFNSAQDYAYGLFIHGDNNTVTFAPGQTTTVTGFAATGIRITGADNDRIGNNVLVSNGATINVGGSQFGIGILASSGANNNIRLAGNILANGGNDARGVVIDFGTNLLPLSGQVTSANYGQALVNSLDISGQITTDAGNNAIQIASSAAVNTINIMNFTPGTATTITGNIFSDALNTGVFNNPNLIFGSGVNAVTGAATGVADNMFAVNLNGNIIGTPVGLSTVQRANLDLTFLGGTTTLGAGFATNVDNVNVTTGNVISNGSFDGLDVVVNRAGAMMGGMATFNGQTSLRDINIIDGQIVAAAPNPLTFTGRDVTVGPLGTFTSSGNRTTVRGVTISGDATGNGTFQVTNGFTTATAITQNGGQTLVNNTGGAGPTLLSVNTYNSTNGNLIVNGATATFNVNTELRLTGTDGVMPVVINNPVVTVQNGGTIIADDFVNDEAVVNVDANLNVVDGGAAEFTNLNSGVLNVGQAGPGVMTADSMSQSSSATTRVFGMGTMTVNGAFTNDGVPATGSMTRSSLTVDAGGTANVGAMTQTGMATTTVNGTYNGGSFTTTDSTVAIAGVFDVDAAMAPTGTGAFTQSGGTTTVMTNGMGAAPPEFRTDTLTATNAAMLNFNGGDGVFDTSVSLAASQLDITNGGSLTTMAPLGTFTQDASITNVTNGTLTTGAFTQTDSTTTVAAAGIWNANSVTTTDSTNTVNGMVNVTNLYDQVTGTTDVNAGATLNAGAFTQRTGITTIDPTGTVNVTNAAAVNNGTMVLNGALTSNTFTLGQNGLLQGNGNLTGNAGVTFNGIVTPGNSIGTITVTTAGTTTFNPTATTRIELNPAGTTPGVHNDLIDVNGTATVNGGTIELTQLGAGTFDVTDQYTFLRTTGGVTVNTPFNVQEVIAGRRFIQLINPNDYRLIVARSGLLTAIGTTPNAQRFGAYLGAVSGNPQAQTLRNALDLIADPNAASFALQSLGGELYASVQTSLMQANSSFLDNLNSTVHGGGHCCGSFAENPLGNGFWNSNYGWGGTDGSDGNAQTAEVRGGGTAIGFGRFLSDTSMVGFFYNAERLDTDIDQLDQSAETETHRLGIYHESRFNSYYLRGVAAAGYSATESQRNFQFVNPIGIISESPRGDFHSWNAMVDIETGWCVTKPQVKIEPLLGLRYIHVSQEGFAEQGGPLTNLIVNNANIDSLRARAGARFSGILPNQATVLSLETFWQMDIYEPPHARSDARLAIAPTSSYFVQGPEYGSGRFVFSPSIRHQWGQHTNFFFRYRGDWADGAHRNAGEAGLEVRW